MTDQTQVIEQSGFNLIDALITAPEKWAEARDEVDRLTPAVKRAEARLKMAALCTPLFIGKDGALKIASCDFEREVAISQALANSRRYQKKLAALKLAQRNRDLCYERMKCYRTIARTIHHD